MKIAYLMQVKSNVNQAGALIQALATYDDVFVSFGELKDKDMLAEAFFSNPNVTIITEHCFVATGGLSVPRTWLILLHNALKKGNYAAYIPVNEFSVPLRPRQELADFIQAHPDTDMMYAKSEDELPNLRKLMHTYVLGTTDPSFENKSWFRNNCLSFGKLLYGLGIRRKKISEKLYQGHPWVLLSNATAHKLSANFAECSDHFALAWFSEEVYFPTFINKYSRQVLNYQLCQMKNWSSGVGETVLTTEDLEIYGDYFFANRFDLLGNEERYNSLIKRY